VLAAVVTILTEFGDYQGLGYDNNCALEVTLHTYIPSKGCIQNRLQCVVGTFHCSAHKLTCYVKFHPLYQPVFGLEDLLTCESFFFESEWDRTKHSALIQLPQVSANFLVDTADFLR